MESFHFLTKLLSDMKKTATKSIWLMAILLFVNFNQSELFAQTLGEKQLVERIKQAISADSFAILQKELAYLANNQLTQANSLNELGLDLLISERHEEAFGWFLV